MPTVIRPLTEEYSHAVADFNSRVSNADGEHEFQFPEQPADAGDGRRLCEQYFVAVEGDSVRGGFILNRQEFWVKGEPRRIAHYRLPLSEGIARREYAGVGVQMLRAALKMEPLLYALGMGGAARPLPQMLKAMGWQLYPVPFHFTVIHPQPFLRELRVLRATPARRILAEACRWSGAGWAGLRLLHSMKTARGERTRAEPMPHFGDWADLLWERVRSRYALVAVRDRAALNFLYPPDSGRFERLLVSKSGAPAGWAVVLDTKMKGHRHFGDLRVGTIADCLAAPEDADVVIRAAAEHLEGRGVDLVVSNQAHCAWRLGLERSGFLRGPSNYVFAASKELARLLDPFDSAKAEIHINRGDGDGPVHL